MTNVGLPGSVLVGRRRPLRLVLLEERLKSEVGLPQQFHAFLYVRGPLEPRNDPQVENLKL